MLPRVVQLALADWLAPLIPVSTFVEEEPVKCGATPVFGIIKSAMGFTRFRLRGLLNAATEWSLVALAYNCRRINRLQAA